MSKGHDNRAHLGPASRDTTPCGKKFRRLLRDGRWKPSSIQSGFNVVEREYFERWPADNRCARCVKSLGVKGAQ